jgi:hypothetical protein
MAADPIYRDLNTSDDLSELYVDLQQTDITNDEFTNDEISRLISGQQTIPDDIIIRRIRDDNMSKFNQLITTSATTPNLTDGKDIKLINNIPPAMAITGMVFPTTETTIPHPTISNSTQKVIDNAFDSQTRQPKKKFNTIPITFEKFFPNNNNVIQNLDRIVKNVMKLIDLTYSLLIKEVILTKLIHNPAARIPSITGFRMPYYSQEYASQYDCFGSTLHVQHQYTELATQIAISTNYNIKTLAQIIIATEIKQIKTLVHKIMSLTDREWAFFVTHPAKPLYPPPSHTLPNTDPPITFKPLYMCMIHIILRDYVAHHSLKYVFPIVQPCVDEYLAILNIQQETFMMHHPYYTTEVCAYFTLRTSPNPISKDNTSQSIIKNTQQPILTLTTGIEFSTYVRTADMTAPYNVYQTTTLSSSTTPSTTTPLEEPDEFLAMLQAEGITDDFFLQPEEETRKTTSSTPSQKRYQHDNSAESSHSKRLRFNNDNTPQQQQPSFSRMCARDYDHS